MHPTTSRSDTASPPLARLQGVRRRRGTVQALDGVDLTLPAAQVTALLGVNGAGKTTAIEILLGLQPADAGEATLFGRAPSDLQARRQVGVMLQQAQLPERLQVGELLALARSWYPQPRSVADCVALAGLDGLLDRRYGRLSGGQQRRVLIARALASQPELFFLDEPTAGVDVGNQRVLTEVLARLVERGATLVVVTHELAALDRILSRAVVVQGGRISYDGPPGGLADDHEDVSHHHPFGEDGNLGGALGMHPLGQAGERHG